MCTFAQRFITEGLEQGLEQGREEGKKEGIEEGGNLMLYSMVQDGDTPPEKGAKRLGISIDELFSRMLSCGYKPPKQMD